MAVFILQSVAVRKVLETVVSFLKGGGHSKKLTFLPSPIASKQSAFPLIEVSASEVPAILRKFVSKEATSEAAILIMSSAARPCLCDVIPSDSKLAGRRKTCNRLCILHKVSEISVFLSKRLSTSQSSLLSFSGFGACLVQNNTSQEQP